MNTRGFLLAGSTAGAVGIAILALVICFGVLLVVYFGRKRQRSGVGGTSITAPHIPLGSYEVSRGE